MNVMKEKNNKNKNKMISKKALLIVMLSISCTSVLKNSNKVISKVTIDTLLLEKINIRAISISGNKVFYAADKNRVGFINVLSNKKTVCAIRQDSLVIEFRSCAAIKDAFFSLSISNPALLYKLSTDLNSKKLVYTEHNANVFYDSMQFYDNWNGIAVGDPINGQMSIITTRDSGETWQKNSHLNSPNLADGEAFFAASNTTISIKNGKTWLVSGGEKSRVFYSEDKGMTWKIFESPIVHGEKMTGTFTSDFYNDKIGIIAGGNYEKPEQNYQNKALTVDGGRTWKLVGENQGFGYASCIQFFPKSAGKKIVSVGLTGMYISEDFGLNWTKLSDDKSLFTLRFLNKNTAIAGGKNKIIKINFQ